MRDPERHEDSTITEELGRLSALGLEAFGRGDFSKAAEHYRAAALICQGAEWMEREATPAG